MTLNMERIKLQVQIDRYSNLYYNQFIAAKLSLQGLDHRKIVHKIYSQYVPHSITIKYQCDELKKGLKFPQIQQAMKNQMMNMNTLNISVVGGYIELEDEPQIQKFFRMMPKLQNITLDMEYSKFCNCEEDEDILVYIKNWMGHLYNLKKICFFMGENGVDYLFNRYLAYILQRNVNLKEIILYLEVNPTGKDIKTILDPLQKLDQLEKLVLSLHNNYMEDQNMGQLAQGLAKLQKLKYLELDVSYNRNIGKEQYKKLAKAIEGIKSLEYAQVYGDGDQFDEQVFMDKNIVIKDIIKPKRVCHY